MRSVGAGRARRGRGAGADFFGAAARGRDRRGDGRRFVRRLLGCQLCCHCCHCCLGRRAASQRRSRRSLRSIGNGRPTGAAHSRVDTEGSRSGCVERAAAEDESAAASMALFLRSRPSVMADGRWWRPGAVSGDTRPCGASGTRYVSMRGLIGSRRVPSSTPRSPPTRPRVRHGTSSNVGASSTGCGVLGGLKCRCGRHVRQGERGGRRGRAGRVVCEC